MKRLYFKTAYDENKAICGYVVPKYETPDYYAITKRQYENALKKLTIGGIAGIIFLADKPVRVRDMK